MCFVHRHYVDRRSGYVLPPSLFILLCWFCMIPFSFVQSFQQIVDGFSRNGIYYYYLIHRFSQHINSGQDYPHLHSYKPGVGPNVALHVALACRASTCLDSCNCICSQTSPILNSGLLCHEQWLKMVPVVPIHCVSPRRMTLRGGLCKPSSILSHLVVKSKHTRG